ncbi:MAG: UDP-N-acetylmuramoyl-L-alanine--D-glutamate ligase [Mogibacterium sp.]|nr:UDP-N-acetylmuramoyl-L-alanine--D-glutamate ligase [Mogibacterium sp.]
MLRGKEYRETLAGKKVLVVGLGKSGKAATRVLNEEGATVYVQDSSTSDRLDTQFLKYMDNEGIAAFLGSEPDDMSIYDMLVLSPGVPSDLAFIKEAEKQGAEIIGEIELAYRISEGNFVAITGTNGKTTTTSLVGKIFEDAGFKTSIVGNIGNPVVTHAEETTSEDWLITEASSFQLETIKTFRPRLATVLNITPDHLNRHKTMEAYAAAKANVMMNQKDDDSFIYNADDETVRRIASNAKGRTISFSMKGGSEPGAYLDDSKVIVRDADGQEYTICDTDDIRIIGDHNIENVLAASAIAFFAGIEVEVISASVKEFAGVEHRIEFCGKVDEVEYYNDSKGTNTDAAIIALKALEKDIILIAGGDAKNQDFDEFAAALEGRVHALILLGRDADIIEEAAKRYGFTDIYRCKDMPECVRKASELAKPGDKVLLSPACASWDMYDNFEQRGRHFKSCIKELLR